MNKAWATPEGVKLILFGVVAVAGIYYARKAIGAVADVAGAVVDTVTAPARAIADEVTTSPIFIPSEPVDIKAYGGTTWDEYMNKLNKIQPGGSAPRPWFDSPANKV